MARVRTDAAAPVGMPGVARLPALPPAVPDEVRESTQGGIAMSAEDCTNPRVAGDAERRVADAMVARPKTLPADATVGELRALFANPHVVSALVVDGATFVGAVARDELAAEVADDRLVRAVARRDVPTIAPDAPLADALRMLDADGSRRLVVLDADGRTLRGLLCLTRDRGGFCQS